MGGCSSSSAQESQSGPAQRTNDDLYGVVATDSAASPTPSAASFQRMEGITVLLLSVLAYLPSADVCARASRVSKLWNSTLRSKSANRFWTSLYAVTYPDQRSVDCDTSVSPQKLFSDRASLWHGIVLPKGDFVVDWVTAKAIVASPTNHAAAAESAASPSKTHCYHRVRYFLDSFKLTFNCDGEALKFSNLTLTVVSDPNTRKLMSIVFTVDQLPRQQLLKIVSVMQDTIKSAPPVTTLMESLGDLCSVDRIQLTMGPHDGLELLTERLPVAGLKHLFALQDSVGGSICLDLYYFRVSLIQHVPPQPQQGWGAYLLSQPDFQSLSPWMKPRAFAARQKNQSWYRCAECDPEELYAICSFCITHSHKGHKERSWIGCTDSRVYSCAVCGEDGTYPNSSSSSSGGQVLPLPTLPLPLCAGMVFKGQVDAVATSVDKVKKVWHLEITIISMEQPPQTTTSSSKLPPLIRFQATMRRRLLSALDEVVPAVQISGALNPSLGSLQFRDRSSGAFFFGQWLGRQLKGIWSIGADVEQQHAGLGLACTLTMVSEHALAVPQSWFASIIAHVSSVPHSSLGPAAEILFDLLTGDQATLYRSKDLMAGASSATSSKTGSGSTPVGVQLLSAVVQRLWEVHGDQSHDRTCVLPMLRLLWALLAQLTIESAAFPLTPLAQSGALDSLDGAHIPPSTSALDSALHLLVSVAESGRSHVDERVIAVRSLVDAGWHSAAMDLFLLRHTALLHTVVLPMLRRVDEAAPVNGSPLISTPVALFKVLTPQTVPLVRECFRLVQCVACNTTAGRKLLFTSGHAALTFRVCAGIDFLKIFAVAGLKSAETTAPAFAGTKDVLSQTEEAEYIALIDGILSASANLLQEPCITSALVLSAKSPLVTLDTFARLVSQLPVCAQLQSFLVSSLAAMANVIEHTTVARNLYYSESEAAVANAAVTRLMTTLVREDTASFDKAESRIMLRCLGSFTHYARLQSLQLACMAPRYELPLMQVSQSSIVMSSPDLWAAVVPTLLAGFQSAYINVFRSLLTDPATESDVSTQLSTLCSWLNLLCTLMSFADTAEHILQRSDVPRMVCAMLRLDEAALRPFFFTLYPPLFRFFNLLCVYHPAFLPTVLSSVVEESHNGAMAQQRLQALSPAMERINFKFGSQDIPERIESALSVVLSDTVHGSLLERVSLASSLCMLLTRLYLDGHLPLSALPASSPSLIHRFCEIAEFQPQSDLDLEFTEIDFRQVDGLQRKIHERIGQPESETEASSSSHSSVTSSSAWLSSSVCILAWCGRAAVSRASNLSRSRFSPTLDSATADLLSSWRLVQGRIAPGGAPSATMHSAQQWIKQTQAAFHDTVDL